MVELQSQDMLLKGVNKDSHTGQKLVKLKDLTAIDEQITWRKVGV
jgi:L-lysine 2,3-aminomutase